MKVVRHAEPTYQIELSQLEAEQVMAVMGIIDFSDANAMFERLDKAVQSRGTNIKRNPFSSAKALQSDTAELFFALAAAKVRG